MVEKIEEIKKEVEDKLPEFKLNEGTVEIEGHKFKVRELRGSLQFKLTTFAGNKEAMQRELIKLCVVEPKLTNKWVDECPSRVLTKIMEKYNELTGIKPDGSGFLLNQESLPELKDGKSDTSS